MQVCVLDVMRRDVLSDDFSEVTSIETWRSLLLICTRSGVWLRDLDNKEVNHQLELQMVATFLHVPTLMFRYVLFTIERLTRIDYSRDSVCRLHSTSGVRRWCKGKTNYHTLELCNLAL